MHNRLVNAIAMILAAFCTTLALAQSAPTVNWVPNPTSGVQLFTLTFRPANAQAGVRYPAIVFVPGGLGTTVNFSDANMQAQADLGFITVKFDPDGRGQSTNGGTYTFEDFGGFIQQDGLHSVLKYVAGRVDVDGNNIHLQSRSFGVTMSAGAIARYPHTPQVKSLVEWEGPADRSDTASFTGHDVADNAWWFEHEPINWLQQFRGDFIAVQSVVDHAQPDHLHTIKLNNRAAMQSFGGTGRARFVRVNGSTGAGSNAPNQTFSGTMLASTLPETVTLEPFLRTIMQEMAARPARAAIADINQNGTVEGGDLAELLSMWGTSNADSDLNDDDVVSGIDLAILLSGWSTQGTGTGPWNNDIGVWRIAVGGTPVRVHTFARAGVSSVVQLASGELVAAFQWFPENNPASFDHIALSRSVDDGLTWSTPTTPPITGLLADDRAPFDPTLIALDDGRIRMYFTMNKLVGASVPRIGSAISTDGIQFALEAGDRFAVSGQMVIDCAVAQLGNTWQLISPIQNADGAAYRATSSDGLNFVRQADLTGPATNRWLGAMIQIPKGLRFYGSSNNGVWSARSTNGSSWTIDSPPPGLPGADPGVAALPNGTLVVTATVVGG
ncbi:MAG: hypothetical protein O2800_07920 [Planctomycetota bacterium]|nr:hypothetical protein [Planctomycetota bacterium]